MSKGVSVIAALNGLIDIVEDQLTEDIDLAAYCGSAGTTEYHLRRMFSSLAGVPLSDYIRRRRMTLASTDVLGEGDLLAIAVRYGYSSTEAFGRAFQSVHGASVGEVRRRGGPLRSQPPIRFRLTVEGNTPLETRITDQPVLRLIGHAAQVPLIHQGVNPHIQAHIASLPGGEHARLKELSDAEPRGLLQISAGVDPDYAEGSELTYLHGVSVSASAVLPDDLDMVEVPAGPWAVFRTVGVYPDALQTTWAATATDWFPSNPWRLRPGPYIVAIIDRAADFGTATTELWLPVEHV